MSLMSDIGTAIKAKLDLKVDKVTGKGLSTEDYTTAEKTKLSGIAASANNYVLPVATASVLGGVKAGTNISIDANGVISANDTSIAWSEITSKPTTLSGYGITDSIQSTLVSGTNIKTINGTSILGSGDIVTTQTSVSGNAGTATKLQTARTINGVSFDGTADITIADNSKAPLASPAFTGTPTAPTPTAGDNSTKIATTAFVLANSNAVTATTVGAATAGIAAAAVGSYAFLLYTSSTTLTHGSTTTGSSLTPAGVASSGISSWGATLSGTWRCMGYAPSAQRASLFLRIA